MDTVIISASPRAVSHSFSAKYSLALSEGICRAGGTSQIFYLSDRSQWHSAVTAIIQGRHTVFVLPIFCGTVPGVLLEFLKKLAERGEEASEPLAERSVAFIVHCGLPGRDDFDCCKAFLMTVPETLRGRFSGIIGIADTISQGFLESEQEKTVQRLRNAGMEYAENTCCFSQPEAFWGSDDMTQAEGEAYCRFANRFCRHVSGIQGCDVPLEYAPYGKRKT